MPEVKLSAVKKMFGDFQAIKGVDLHVKDGEFLTFLGPSGCGKSTTLRMLAGYIYPDEGRIFLGKDDVTHVSPSKRNIGMVFQNFALFPHMSIFENVAFGLNVRRVAPDERKNKVEQVLDLVRLSGLGARFPRELSGGQQQRVALARAVVFQPSLLLLDEPLSALDLKLRQELQNYIKEVQKELGITTIYVTHDQGEALRLSDRIAVMANGEIAQIGTPTEIYARPNSNFVAKFIGEMNVIDIDVAEQTSDAMVCSFFGNSEPPSVLKARNIQVGSAAEKMVFGVRPEVISLGKDGENAVTGTIKDLQYSGSIWTITVATDVGNLNLEVQGRTTPPEVGSRQTISWSATDSFVFPRQA